MKGFVDGYYNLCVWVTRFAYLNLLWVAFSVLGLLFIGFMPATVGMFAVVRKWVMGETDIPIFKTFWKSYRKEFLKANLLGYILFGIGYLLNIELQILRAQESMVYFIASFGVLALMLMFYIIVLYVLPVFTHFNLKTFDYIKWPFVIGIVHPILTIFLAVGVIFINYVTFITIPALLFFFGGSVTAFILMWGASQTFAKYERVEV